MVTINTESALTPRSLRDTRRMNMFVSVAAAVAGLLFGLDIGVSPERCRSLPSLCADQSFAGMGG